MLSLLNFQYFEVPIILTDGVDCDRKFLGDVTVSKFHETLEE